MNQHPFPPLKKFTIDDESTSFSTTALFLFNHIISRFDIPRAIVTDYGSHFQNKMMAELNTKLGFCHDKSTPYYPQENDQMNL